MEREHCIHQEREHCIRTSKKLRGIEATGKKQSRNYFFNERKDRLNV